MIIAPSGKLSAGDLDPATAILEQWGLHALIGEHVFDGYGFFASSDEGRLSDLQNALDNQSIKAVFCARGGYGMGRIIDKLEFRKFIDDPKWVIGFSDITLLHMKLHCLGFISIHGPVARQIGTTIDRRSIDSLKNLLFGSSQIQYKTEPLTLNENGNSDGQLIGGNLTMLCNNLGTNSDVEFNNKILFIEDTNEALYSIDRHMNQLQRANKLKGLSGLIVGHFTNTKDTTPPYNKSTYEVISEYVEKFEFPVCFGFPLGHEGTNLSLPVSGNANLDVTDYGGLLSLK